MFCTHCGAQIPDDATFCPACGQPTGNRNHPNGNPRPGRPGLSADTVTKIAKSPLTLAFIIIFSVQILLGVYLSFAGHSITIFSFLATIIDILLCVGCWLVYAGNSQNQLASTGFSILRVMMLIYLVFQLVNMVISFIGSYSLFYNMPIVLGVLACLILLVIFGWCYYGLFRTTNDGWKILQGEAVKWRVSLFSIIMLIILAVLELIYMIIFILSSVQFVITLNYLTIIATYVLGIIILFKIRGKSKDN